MNIPGLEGRAAMSVPLRVAIVGAGRIARVHADALEGSSEARLVAIADPRWEAARALSLETGCPAYGSAEEMIERERPEAAIVCTPPNYHAAVTQYLLGEGIHVLCEKPLARELGEAKAMIGAACLSGCRLVLAAKYRFVPGVGLARKLLLAGSLGDPQRAEITFAQKVEMKGNWYADPKVSGGGVMADNGPHAVDLLRFLFGPVEAVHVVEGPRPQGLAVEESVEIQARAGEGVMARIHLSWNVGGGETYLTVHGTEGTLELGWKGCRCRTPGAEEWTPLAPGYDRAQAFRALHQSFVLAAQGLGEPEGSPDDALATATVVAAAYASLERGDWVEVDGGAASPAAGPAAEPAE
jgi:predicted dehydrogenase